MLTHHTFELLRCVSGIVAFFFSTTRLARLATAAIAAHRARTRVRSRLCRHKLQVRRALKFSRRTRRLSSIFCDLLQKSEALDLRVVSKSLKCCCCLFFQSPTRCEEVTTAKRRLDFDEAPLLFVWRSRLGGNRRRLICRGWRLRLNGGRIVCVGCGRRLLLRLLIGGGCRLVLHVGVGCRWHVVSGGWCGGRWLRLWLLLVRAFAAAFHAIATTRTRAILLK